MHPTLQILERCQDSFDGFQNILAVNPPEISIFNQFANCDAVSTDYSVVRQCPEKTNFGLFDLETKYDAVLLFMPKSKKEFDMLLQYSLAKLSGSELFLVGEKKSGVASAAKRLSQFGTHEKLDSAKHCQLWRLETDEQNVHTFELEEWYGSYEFKLHGKTYKVATIPGVFSQDGLDPGTELLLNSISNGVIKKPNGRFLDFACGSGVIASVVKTLLPELKLELVDVNWLALECAKRTALLNEIEYEVYPSDGWSDVEGRVDGVITNPPFHSGIDTDYSVTENFIRVAPSKMTKYAPLLLVANHFLKYAGHIDAAFSYCEVVAETSKFKLYYTSR